MTVHAWTLTITCISTPNWQVGRRIEILNKAQNVLKRLEKEEKREVRASLSVEVGLTKLLSSSLSLRLLRLAAGRNTSPPILWEPCALWPNR